MSELKFSVGKQVTYVDLNFKIVLAVKINKVSFLINVGLQFNLLLRSFKFLHAFFKIVIAHFTLEIVYNVWEKVIIFHITL